MDQEQKMDAPADDRSKMTARKHWHSPRFFVTDVIATNSMAGLGAHEAGNPNSSS